MISVAMVSNIIGTPNLLFLGAGASKPYGKMLMGEFVESFRTKANYGSLVSTDPDRDQLLNDICSQKKDLEFLIGELEALVSLSYLGSSKKEAWTFDRKVPDEEWPEFDRLTDTARRLLVDLRREIYRHYRSFPRPPVPIGMLADLVDLLRTPQFPDVVFTTNYDLAVETLCTNKSWQLNDGFRHDELRQE
jgi:hypothetical protein